jgi:hypothetical protein
MILILIIIINTPVFGQNFTETIETEEISNGVNTFLVKRRLMTFDENLNMIKETYYGFDDDSYMKTKIIGSIDYSNSGLIDKIITYIKYPQKYIEVNFKNGSYTNYLDKTYLKFNNNFVFNGLQEGNKIIINYKDGKRNGICIQTDSGVIYKKNISYNLPNIKLLQFNLLRFSQQISNENVYQLFNGLICNFNDDKINGNVNGYYLNGNIKLESTYSNGLISKYISYNQEKSISNKINNTKNGLINNKIILNGTIDSEKYNYFIFNDKINKIGKIIEIKNNSIEKSTRLNDQFYKKGISFDFNQTKNINKIIIDKNKIIFDHPNQILSLLNIPLFDIKRIGENDENYLQFLKIPNTSLDSTDMENISEEITSSFIFQNENIDKINFLKKDLYESILSDEINKEILKSQINYIIYNSYLLKENKMKIDSTGIDNVLYLSEGLEYIKDDYSKKITLLDSYSNKNIEIINIVKNNINQLGTYLYGTQYTYFDGSRKFKFVFKYIQQKVLIEKYWIE